MSIYLIEPYNPYNKHPHKKKHWMEIAEEEAMLARIMEAKNASLPPNSPDPSVPSAVGNPAGGGGVPELPYFRRTVVSTFTADATTGVVPFTATFTNTSTKYVDISWNFGDGTTATGNVVSHTFTGTGSFTASMTASSNGVDVGSSQIFSSSLATVTPSFIATPLTGSTPLTVQFTNTSTTTSTESPTYLWLFGTGSLTQSFTEQASSSAVSPSFTYWNSGSYTVTLQATASFNQYFSTSSINMISSSA